MTISMISFPSLSPSLPSLSSCRDYIDAKTKQISQVFYDYLLYPIEVGAVAGVVDAVFCFSLIAIELLVFDVKFAGGIREDFHSLLISLLKYSLVIPVIEEVVFRVCIQGSVKRLAEEILPDREISILGYVKLPLSSLVSIVATSIFFGALHYSNAGTISVVSATLGGINFGLLKEKVGLLGSITAHGVTNGLLIAADVVMSSRV